MTIACQWSVGSSPSRDAVLRALVHFLRGMPSATITVCGPGASAVFQLPEGSDVATVGPSEPTPAPSEVAHSDDFRSVRWHGRNSSFTPTQAACVKLLWQAWEQGVPDVVGPRLLDVAGSECVRVSDIFRAHPAWGSLIARGGSRGTFRLLDPAPVGE